VKPYLEEFSNTLRSARPRNLARVDPTSAAVREAARGGKVSGMLLGIWSLFLSDD
jgi:hypothetical protein